MRFLNLGCGTKTSSKAGVVNIDWSIALRIRSNPVLRAFAPLFMNGDRLTKFKTLPESLMVHDLSKGIPFEDNSSDVAYHSHVLEHIDREIAPLFIKEIHRVLKPGGILRIAVPDMERNCRNYIKHIDECAERGAPAIAVHDDYLMPILDQAVRREAGGTRRQSGLRRWLENFLLGDARKRGETHQWMYDRFNLEALLRRHGFTDVKVQSYDTSAIPDWISYGLDRNADGTEYIPGSLYVEAIKGK